MNCYALWPTASRAILDERSKLSTRVHITFVWIKGKPQSRKQIIVDSTEIPHIGQRSGKPIDIPN